jgi:pimeloyl-ACP methyl ester carboxylesterase
MSSDRRRRTLSRGLAVAGLLALTATGLRAQPSCPRILVQDSTLNNLVDPPGYATARLGTLGGVTRAGTGPRAMILIPGLGFGGGVFTDFMRRFEGEYRMYAVTLPGFGGTAAPPSPGEKVSFGSQTWTNGALAAVGRLIEEEKLQDPVIVGHWLTGTQLALRLALERSDVRAVVLLAGAAKMVVTDTALATYYGTLERRVATVDRWLAPRWFRTVTRETWDDNNFLPGDYAEHPVRGLRLWREAASPKLHVWVRYLCEFNAQDVSLELGRLTVPILLLEPGLEGNWHEAGQDYMRGLCRESWDGRASKHPRITVKTIPGARVGLWFDQPEAVHEAVAGFLKSVGAR